jgi:1-aminocyclopropane-1-carboxylate deaminase/D-cysteine desulfhydrase
MQDCFVKRDDELSFGISGCKYRKYASLMPYLKQKGIRQLLVIASAASNNLLAALQMGAEFGISVIPFLLEPHQLSLKGNYLYSNLFLQPEVIHWVPRANWGKVNELARDFISSQSKKTFLLPEGAFCQPALIGAKTLADSLIQNEKELSTSFQHIFVDAGTGLSAIGLIARLKELTHPAQVYVLTLADSKEVFLSKLEKEVGLSLSNIEVFESISAKSFGAVNKTVKNQITQVAKEEGIILDPIYSAKLFLNARSLIQARQLEGAKLLVHSGGALSLSGFSIGADSAHKTML